jgi:hypothetical protein
VKRLDSSVNSARGKVNHQQSDADSVRIYLKSRDPAERSANSCKQFRRAEGLRYEIVSSGIKRRNFVFLRVANRQHDDRNVLVAPHYLAGSQTSHAGHIDIEQQTKTFSGFYTNHLLTTA